MGAMRVREAKFSHTFQQTLIWSHSCGVTQNTQTQVHLQPTVADTSFSQPALLMGPLENQNGQHTERQFLPWISLALSVNVGGLFKRRARRKNMLSVPDVTYATGL